MAERGDEPFEVIGNLVIIGLPRPRSCCADWGRWLRLRDRVNSGGYDLWLAELLSPAPDDDGDGE